MQLRIEPNLRWTRWAEALALLVAVLGATAYSLLLTRHTGTNVTMWIANGVVVGALLRVPDERWPLYLAAAFVGYFAGKMLLGDPLLSSALLGLVHGVEVMIVARGVRWRFPRIEDDTPFLRLGQVAMLSTLVASLVSAGLAAFMADYHALIKSDDPARIERSRLEIAATWLAAGLDPDRVTFYRQSDIPEIPELTWFLTCVTAKGLLNRAHAYKAAVDKNTDAGEDADAGVTAGLYMSRFR